MDERTMMGVMRLPNPWPPPETILLLREAGGFELRADEKGRLILSRGNWMARFQPIRLDGPGHSVIISVDLSESNPRIYVGGGKPLLLNAEEVRTVTGGGSMVGRELIHPNIVSLDLSQFEQHDGGFLDRLRSIDRTAIKGEYHRRMRSAGLLRQLLLDTEPLLHKVNRTRNLRVKFEVPPAADMSQFGEIQAQIISIDPYKLGDRMPHTDLVGLKSFLGKVCFEFQDKPVSVKDVIRICANVKGGVHFGRPDARQHAQIEFDKSVRIFRRGPLEESVVDISRVTLRAVRPLVEAILAGNASGRPEAPAQPI